jgi:hypothetical protein
MEQLDYAKTFHYVDPWGDIGVFLGNYFLIGCCYQEYGECFDPEDIDLETRELYNLEDNDYERDKFVRDIEIVLSAHNYSFFDPVFNPYNGDPDDIRIHNEHVIQVW